jgi:hypothetical protein
MSERNDRHKKDFLEFLKYCERAHVTEDADLEELLKTFDEEPEIFQKKWLQPLLAEGLNLRDACGVVVESIFHPN